MSVATVRHPALCHSCEVLLNSAADRIRRHAALVVQCIQLSHSALTDEERLAFRASLKDTFDDAQNAWDTYRNHLIEHGFLPPA